MEPIHTICPRCKRNLSESDAVLHQNNAKDWYWAVVRVYNNRRHQYGRIHSMDRLSCALGILLSNGQAFVCQPEEVERISLRELSEHIRDVAYRLQHYEEICQEIDREDEDGSGKDEVEDLEEACYKADLKFLKHEFVLWHDRTKERKKLEGLRATMKKKGSLRAKKAK
jgi:hypothetical protein